eukprot:scaffold44295_cov28-Tisochrysis_lutea.AAC.3
MVPELVPRRTSRVSGRAATGGSHATAVMTRFFALPRRRDRARCTKTLSPEACATIRQIEECGSAKRPLGVPAARQSSSVTLSPVARLYRRRRLPTRRKTTPCPAHANRTLSPAGARHTGPERLKIGVSAAASPMGGAPVGTGTATRNSGSFTPLRVPLCRVRKVFGQEGGQT